MSPVLSIAFLWAAFGGSHILLSSAAVRPALVRRLGARGFQGLYSIVALATFIPLVRVFGGHRHAGPLLWTTIGPAELARAVNHVLMGAAFVFLVGSLLPGSTPPSAMQARGTPAVRGLTRITRHPLMTAFALFGIAHLLVNGSLGDVVFFGGFVAFAWLGARHQDARKVRDVPGYDRVVETTSVVPLAAMLRGRQRLRAGEAPVLAVGLGIAMTVIVRMYHGRLFGP
jgi:uncharacterized membrane protein